MIELSGAPSIERRSSEIIPKRARAVGGPSTVYGSCIGSRCCPDLYDLFPVCNGIVSGALPVEQKMLWVKKEHFEIEGLRYWRVPA